MYGEEKLSLLFKTSRIIPFDDSSKIILMSDCHRGDGTWADTFCKNQSIYYAALNYYYNQNFTYIELGDGDELWENVQIGEIMKGHSNVFSLLSKFVKKKRAYFIYGNHDISKKNKGFINEKESKYFDECNKRSLHAFLDVEVYESLVLKYKDFERKILLVHGHQVDLMNSRLWKLSRFLVRYLWKPMEILGVHDPTSAAKNYSRKEKTEMKLIAWVKKNNHVIISGHTHRPMFPEGNQPSYFNDGSCVHPYGITGIEICNGEISLVKWGIKARYDGTLYVGREILAGPKKVEYYL